MSEHTNGEDNNGWYVEKDGVQIAYGMTEADARRIVACLNACYGISTETLESRGMIPITALEQQRDKMVRELKRVANIRVLASMYHGNSNESYSQQIRALLAEVDPT